MIGWVAGDMIGADPVFGEWLATHVGWGYHFHAEPLGDINVLQVLGAVSVVVCGKWLAARAAIKVLA
jgi:hypothetical protein